MLQAVVAKSSEVFAAPCVGTGVDTAFWMQPAQCFSRGENVELGRAGNLQNSKSALLASLHLLCGPAAKAESADNRDGGRRRHRVAKQKE